ncbi:L-alanine-DL-glutamate epimerase, partial [bacterium]|nr:L-alanine-DL-glutamate epimerase [bacterium]
MCAKEIKIEKINCNFEREQLIRPFGFKGGYMSEIWQSISFLTSTSGNTGLGIGTQSVLWSDASVFASHSEAGGNALMFAMTEFALKRAKGLAFSNPIELLEKLVPDVHEYGKKITNNPDLRLTFALN